jgi:glycosyltransferase involved in cell wall biosynthesis
MSGWRGRTVLVVSPTPTEPADFGNRRYILNSLRLLQAQGARIVFVYYPAEHDWRTAVPLDQLHAMQAQWEAFYLAPVTRRLHAEPAGSHHQLDEWWDESLGGLLRWIFSTHRIDVCIVNYTWLSHALELCPPGVLRVLVTHDRFTGRKEMLLEHGIAPEFFYLTEERERLGLLRADIVWAIKEDEAQAFRALSGRPTLVFPHFEAPDLAYRCRVPRAEPLRFGFLAARNNVNAVNYRRFFAMLGRMVQHWLLPARFILAGSLCDLLEEDAFPFLERLGRVESVESFYRAVDVVVVPMAFSTGLKIKVGEALGYGKALIAHAHAMDGYLPCHRFHALDSFEAMGAAILELIDAPALIDEMEPAAIRSARDAGRRAADCARTTIAGAERPRRCVVQVPADLLALPQVVDHLCETCHYLSHIDRPDLYVTGDATTVAGAVWRRLARHAQITAAPLADMAAQDAPGLDEISFLDAAAFRMRGCVVLYSLRCDEAFRAWHGHAEDLLLRLERWGTPPQPADDFGRDCAALAAWSGRADGSGRAVTLIGTEGAEAGVRLAGVSARLVRVPLLHGGSDSALLRRVRAQPRGGLCLLVGEDDRVLRHLAASPAFRSRWGSLPRSIAGPPGLLDTLRDDPGFAGFRLIAASALPAMLDEAPRVPDLFVDLATDPAAHSWLREICALAALPFLSLADLPRADGAAAQAGCVAAPAPAAARARRVLGVLDAVLSEPFVAVERQALTRSGPAGSDAGWAWLWRLVKERIDPD